MPLDAKSRSFLEKIHLDVVYPPTVIKKFEELLGEYIFKERELPPTSLREYSNLTFLMTIKYKNMEFPLSIEIMDTAGENIVGLIEMIGERVSSLSQRLKDILINISGGRFVKADTIWVKQKVNEFLSNIISEIENRIPDNTRRDILIRLINTKHDGYIMLIDADEQLDRIAEYRSFLYNSLFFILLKYLSSMDNKYVKIESTILRGARYRIQAPVLIAFSKAESWLEAYGEEKVDIAVLNFFKREYKLPYRFLNNIFENWRIQDTLPVLAYSAYGYSRGSAPMLKDGKVCPYRLLLVILRMIEFSIKTEVLEVR